MPGNDELRDSLRLRLQQHRVHIDRGRDATGARLQGLRPPDLAALFGHRRVVRHVLRLERAHLKAAAREETRKPRDEQRFPDIGAGALQHQRAGHQNSIPACALTPARNGCLTKLISVTRSAASMSSAGALRPVTITCRSRRFALSAAMTSSSGKYP